MYKCKMYKCIIIAMVEAGPMPTHKMVEILD